MKRALLSVSDKTGIVTLAQRLAALGFEIISTGGTHKAIADAGIDVKEVSTVTGFPECMDGRVKTLHPAIHGGLLARRDLDEHMEEAAKLKIDMIDFVAVNLYPFAATIKKDNVELPDAIEQIDIGGPSMLRSSAKNHKDVIVVCDPRDYDAVLDKLESGDVDYAFRLKLAQKVFAHTAHYDALIADYLMKQSGEAVYPDTLTLTYEKSSELRYGENPHQRAAFYTETIPPLSSLANAKQLHGKELSFNNYNDTHGALELLKEFSEPTLVACKHGNPCGVGSGATLKQAFDLAYASDPVSIFGGILAANRTIDAETAEGIANLFIEVVIAPSYTKEALAILTKKKNIRLLELPIIECAKGIMDIKRVSGGILVQETDSTLNTEFVTVTQKSPTKEQLESLRFAWRVVKHVKSNAICLANANQTIGIGVGQVSRIWACEQAIEHAQQFLDTALEGAVMASDGFFPFPDCVEAAAAVGIKAIVQPGGSQNDKASIEACDRLGIAMVIANERHFRH